jgi:hypothetical protein
MGGKPCLAKTAFILATLSTAGTALVLSLPLPKQVEQRTMETAFDLMKPLPSQAVQTDLAMYVASCYDWCYES